MNIEGNLEEFTFCSINAPRMDEKGTTLLGVPANFRLVKSDKGYQIIGEGYHTHVFRSHNGNSSAYRPEPNVTNLHVTREEVLFALEHGHFARIGHDTLIRVERTKKKKSKKK